MPARITGAAVREPRNIIPNETPAPYWVQRVMPEVEGKISGFALNVPVQAGSLLDMTVAFAAPGATPECINDLYVAAAAAQPELIAVTGDPIVVFRRQGLFAVHTR